MTSPITSVPDPSESSALASIITQVQPGQVPVAVRGARPTQAVAKKAPTGDASRKKKKKRKGAAATHAPSAQAEEEAAQLRTQDEAVAAAARLGSEAAQSQARANSSATASTSLTGAAPAIPSAIVSQADAETNDETDAQHSHQASSTLVGSSTAGNTLTPKEALPVAEAASPEIDATDSDRAPGRSSDKSHNPPTTTESSEGTVEKDGLIDVPPRRHAPGDSAPATTPAVAAPAPSPHTATRPAQAAASATGANVKSSVTPTQPASSASRGTTKRSKPSFSQKLVAFLTCSSATKVAVKEEMREKNRTTASVPSGPAARSNKNAATAASKVTVPPRTSNTKGGSGTGAEYPTTPGGGTKLPKAETGDVMSGAVVPPGASFVTADEARKSRTSSLSQPHGDESLDDDNDEDEDDEDEDEDDDDEMDLEDEDGYLTDDQTEEQRLIMQGGAGIPLDEFGNPCPLLPVIGSLDTGRKCLVLDLDETLVHSSFKMIQNADFIVPVEIDGTVHNVYVIKRPGVDEFMRQMGLIYEVVVFTASLSKYADPVLDMLDIHHAVRHRLFRESCYNHKGNYVKDLSQLGRDIADTIIIDNSPASYIFHPNNAVPISSWFNDPHDTELTDLVPFLADLAVVQDVRAVLDGAL